MKTGNLTPKSNNEVKTVRYSGTFGQPDGFGSVLEVSIRASGEVSLCLTYRGVAEKENSWGTMLTHEQGKHLANLLNSYEPILWEEV